MKRINIIICVLLSLLLLSCDDKDYKGEYLIINDCDVAIDTYTVGRNAPSIGNEFEIHDHIPANSTLSLRKITISEKATVKDVFVYIEIYKSGQKAIKNPMDQDIWLKTLSNKNLTYTLVIDSSFFR